MTAGLSWFRVDSDIAQNPKIAQLVADHGQKGLAAAFVFICSIGHSAGHNTDGEVTKGVSPHIYGNAALARLLVEAGLWEVTDKGWVIPGYAESQPTRATLDAEADKRSEAGRKAANARWGNG